MNLNLGTKRPPSMGRKQQQQALCLRLLFRFLHVTCKRVNAAPPGGARVEVRVVRVAQRAGKNGHSSLIADGVVPEQEQEGGPNGANGPSQTQAALAKPKKVPQRTSTEHRREGLKPCSSGSEMPTY